MNSHHIDFRMLHSDVPGEGFEALVRQLGETLGLSVEWVGRGADDGKDLIFIDLREGIFGKETVRWLVQCKDYSQSGRSVSETDVGSILDKIHQHKVDGYLLATTTTVSAALKKKLDALDIRHNGPIRTYVWDGADLRKLLTDKAPNLLEIHFLRQNLAPSRLDRKDIALLNHDVETIAVIVRHHMEKIQTHLAEFPQINSEVAPLLYDCQLFVNELSFLAKRMIGPALYFDPSASFKLTRPFFESIESRARQFAELESRGMLVIEMPQADELRNVPMLKISGFALEMIILELVRNGVRYKLGQSDPIKVFVEYGLKGIQISVENAGIIDVMPGEEDKIFLPGFRGRQARLRSNRGAGFGLFLIGVIARQCGGSIEFAREKERIRFTITIPKAEREMPPLVQL